MAQQMFSRERVIALMAASKLSEHPGLRVVFDNEGRVWVTDVDGAKYVLEVFSQDVWETRNETEDK